MEENRFYGCIFSLHIIGCGHKVICSVGLMLGTYSVNWSCTLILVFVTIDVLLEFFGNSLAS